MTEALDRRAAGVADGDLVIYELTRDGKAAVQGREVATSAVAELAEKIGTPG